MYKLIFILFLLLITLYLAKNKLIEPLGPVVRDTVCSDTIVPPLEPPLGSTYLSGGRINYQLLQHNIDKIDDQYDILKEVFDKLKFNIGDVETYTQQKPVKLNIIGNYPNDIKLFFYLNPGEEGLQGDKGIKGDIGDKGIDGERGNRGLKGGSQQC